MHSFAELCELAELYALRLDRKCSLHNFSMTLTSVDLARLTLMAEHVSVHVNDLLCGLCCPGDYLIVDEPARQAAESVGREIAPPLNEVTEREVGVQLDEPGVGEMECVLGL